MLLCHGCHPRTQDLPPLPPRSWISTGPAHLVLSTSNGQCQGLPLLYCAWSPLCMVKERECTASTCLPPPPVPPRQPILNSDSKAVAWLRCKPQRTTSTPLSNQWSRIQHSHQTSHNRLAPPTQLGQSPVLQETQQTHGAESFVLHWDLIQVSPFFWTGAEHLTVFSHLLKKYVVTLHIIWMNLHFVRELPSLPWVSLFKRKENALL